MKVPEPTPDKNCIVMKASRLGESGARRLAAKKSTMPSNKTRLTPRPTRSADARRRSGAGTMLRRQHPLPFGRDEVLALSEEALLMRLKVRDALPNLLAL